MFKFLRKDLLLVVMIAAVFLSLSYGIGYMSDGAPTPTELQPNFLGGAHAPKTQTATGRVWKDHSFEKMLALDSTILSDPKITRVDDTGQIYAMDWADFKVKMFSPEGKFLKSFGEGKGDGLGTGAGAFINPTSFSVRPGGDVWVSDPQQRKITHFNPNGGAQALALPDAVYRIAAVGDVLFTMSPPGQSALFKVYNPTGEQLKSFGEIIQEQPGNGIVLDGYIVGDAESNGFVYGGRYMGVMAGYDANGEQRFVVRTIDVPTPPKVLDIGGKRKMKPNSTQSILTMSIMGDQLYVLSGAAVGGAGGAAEQVMDVYDKRDGTYLFSLKLPVGCKEAVVRPGYVYTRDDGGVTVWRFAQRA
jgi:hypothetical protein